jgi:mannitol/fructose-specific phosphotransferase system IIA component (Ntr-type)
MLTDHLTPDRIRFAEDVPTWQRAVELVTEPLVADGSITPTYIDLGFGIALAHARPEQGVVRPGLSFLRVRPSVLLADDPAHPIDLFLCLAATDSSEHMQTMQELATLLTDDDARGRLLAATTPADVTAALSKTGQNA